MAAIDELREAGGRRSFVLEIDGVPVRYYSGAAPTAKVMTNTAGALSYVDRPSLVNIGAIEASYALAGGIAEFSPFEVSIAVRDTLDTYDAFNVFGRTGALSATYASQVLSTVASTTAGSVITVEDDATVLSFPRLMHIGDEAVWCSGAAAGATNTVTIAARGSGGTLPQRHVADTVDGDVPIITTEPVFFRSRLVVLYARAERGPFGGASGTVEVMRGFIEGAPACSDDATVMTLSIQPLTALLDQVVGSTEAKAGIVEGWHYYSRDRNEIAHIQAIDSNADYYQVGAAAAVGDYTIDIVNAHVTDHQELFDAPAGVAPALPIGHPRLGAVWSIGNPPVAPLDYNGGSGFVLFTAGAGIPRAVPASARLYPAAAAELHILSIVDTSAGATLQPWPEVLVAACNSTTGWAPGDHTGLGGQWSDIEIRIDTDNGDYMEIRPNTPRSTTCVFWRDSEGFASASEVWRRAKSWADRQPVPNDNQAVTRPLNGGILHPDDMGILFLSGDDHLVDFRIDVDVDARTVINLAGHATGWYAPGERYILVDKSIPIGGSGMTTIRIEYTDPRSGERAAEPILTRIVTSTEKKGPDGSTVGYLLELDADEYQDWAVPGFGNWRFPGHDRAPTEPVVIETVVEFPEDTAPADIILRLLHSVNGQKVNSTDYDVLPWGAGIPEAAIDAASIEGFPYPPELASWSFRYPKGATVREVLDPMLKAFGGILTMRTDSTGACRLTMLPVGMETRVEAVQTIAAGDWQDSHQSWGADDETRNVFRFRFNFDAEGDPQDVVEIRDKRSIRNARGEIREMEFDLLGLRLGDRGRAVATDTFRNLWARFIATLGSPRRTWHGSVRTGQAIFANLGAVYNVSSNWLKGYADGIGVSGASARLKSASIDLWNEGANLSFVHFGTRGTGWNASAEVLTVPGITTISVYANQHSDTTDPHTGVAQVDVSGFHTNDVILAVPHGNNDSAAQITITFISHASPYTIAFSGAHGLHTIPGGYICPATYGVATAAHTDLAYIGVDPPDDYA